MGIAFYFLKLAAYKFRSESAVKYCNSQRVTYAVRLHFWHHCHLLEEAE
jgi:hypothetical protein